MVKLLDLNHGFKDIASQLGDIVDLELIEEKNHYNDYWRQDVSDSLLGY